MSTDTLTRAWTDVEFRATLSDAELDLLANPAGDLDAEMNELAVQEATAVSTACTKWSGLTPPRRCCC
ncbi:mersacidin/lichenicidin family type 2 lantibiotic [Stackebrandtia albiflava]|uniref:Mersacidin/lichenicidin family type 2 lantibiotic n=1 Tax=Stackebrandtia albiflava TaxID=406432 RepID=A0A562VDG4_9ACTN|nr:mersacidin/lichenicidin family type 2 lantibiotic [Stackebrandtia albiflava]TWJ15898.1 mersacidin/lichenicidin family type 2 lantibiotic [Stackebrandtia albiflava]